MEDVSQSVWLVGLSGAGKSTVGPLLARRLGYRFVDLDSRVEALAGETIAEVFRRGGETRFRALEGRATAELAACADTVVATGGGWMARSDIERSRDGRVRLWLRVRPETAIHRLSEDDVEGRPLLVGPDAESTLAALLELRRAAYAEAELIVETDGRTVDEVVDTALEGLGPLGFQSDRNKEIEKHS